MARINRCPNCDTELTYIEPEADVGIEGGWVCEACDYSAPLDSYEEE